MQQPSIAIVNDISGYGRCSVTTALPILSAMKIQCGVVPTAILSNHTEYPEYTMLDFTPYMQSYIDTWKRLGFHFDGIYTGFLGSAEQIAVIAQMIHDFSFPVRVMDPVMGDHGGMYDSYTPALCAAMRELVKHATLITPNLTELCLLTDTPYRPNFTPGEIQSLCDRLAADGISQIVVTGIEHETKLGNAIYENGQFDILYTEKVHPLRPGTGDVFASILAGCIIRHVPLTQAVQTASHFITACLITSAEMHIPVNDGVCFEEHLHMLVPSSKQEA